MYPQPYSSSTHHHVRSQAFNKASEKRAASKKQAASKKKANQEKANQEVGKLISAVEAADTPKAFADAMDTLSLWIIAQGPPLPPPGGPWADQFGASPLPQGFRTRELVSRCKAARDGLPRVAYPCSDNREGVCFFAGFMAEDALKSMLVELRKRAPLQYDTPYGPVSF